MENIFERFHVEPPVYEVDKETGSVRIENVNVIGADFGDGDLCGFLWEHNSEYSGAGGFNRMYFGAYGPVDRKPNVLNIRDGVPELLRKEDVEKGYVLQGVTYSNFKRLPGDTAKQNYVFEDDTVSEEYTYEDLMAISFNCMINEFFDRNSIGCINPIDWEKRTIIFVGRPSNRRWAEQEQAYQKILTSRLSVPGYEKPIDVIVISEAMAAFAKHNGTKGAAEKNGAVVIQDNGSSTTDSVVIVSRDRKEDGETSRTLGGGDLDACLLRVLMGELDGAYGPGNYAFQNPTMMRMHLRFAKERYFGARGDLALSHKVQVGILVQGEKQIYRFELNDEKMKKAMEETPLVLKTTRYGEKTKYPSWMDACKSAYGAAYEKMKPLFPNGDTPDRLILTGGVSVMPQVRRWTQEAFHVEPELDDTPNDSVAYGLAYMAATEVRKQVYLKSVEQEIRTLVKTAPGFLDAIAEAGVKHEWAQLCDLLAKWRDSPSQMLSLDDWWQDVIIHYRNNPSLQVPIQNGTKDWYHKQEIREKIRNIIRKKFEELLGVTECSLPLGFDGSQAISKLKGAQVRIPYVLPRYESGKERERPRTREDMQGGFFSGTHRGRISLYKYYTETCKEAIQGTGIRAPFRKAEFQAQCETIRDTLVDEMLPLLKDYIEELTPYFIT